MANNIAGRERMKNDQRGFDKLLKAWNDRFSADEYIFGKEPNAYLVSHASLLRPGQRALLVADGEGRNGVWCAQQGMIVDAFDLSPVGIAKARQLAAERGVQVNFQVCGSEDWNWTPETYDAVILIFAHFVASADREQLFANCIGTLKNGGLLMVQGYTPKQLEFKTGGPQEVELLYTEDWLRGTCSLMDILECRSYEAEINEGTRHVGMSALCGLLARKRSV
jgi:2-polyprenyl-3-methyl-5-hydroxy-6-metoxy-1,4-benzoquinol methylase